MSLVLLGILNSQAGGAASPYYIYTLGGAGTENFLKTKPDSSGNIYGIGRTNSTGTSGSYDNYICKLDSTGAVQWQRVLGSTSFDEARGIDVDSSGNVYVAGNLDVGATRKPLFAKYNSSGVLQFQKTITTSNLDDMYDIAVDASGNIHTLSRAYSGSNYKLLVNKFDSSGTSIWQREVDPAAGLLLYNIIVDASGNVFISFAYDAGGTSYDGGVIMFNSSGTVQWQRRYYSTGFDTVGGLIKGPSGYLYLTGRFVQSSNTEGVLMKINPVGTPAIQWARKLGGASGDTLSGIGIDSSENIYAVGTNNSSGAGGADWLIAKYNSSGTIQWQREFGSTNSEYPYTISLPSDDIFHASGFANLASSDFLGASLPTDGSLTGTYSVGGVDFTYAASSLTEGAASISEASLSFSVTTPSYAIASGTAVDASISLTQQLTSI